MTTIQKRFTRCFVCELESIQQILASLLVEDFHLDGRRVCKDMVKVEGMVQFCPHCGYSAPDISREFEAVREFYKYISVQPGWKERNAQMRPDNIGFVTKALINYYIIMSQLHLGEALKVLLQLIWHSEDSGIKELIPATIEFRHDAVMLIRPVMSEYGQLEAVPFKLLEADLERRNGRQDSALEAVTEAEESLRDWASICSCDERPTGHTFFGEPDEGAELMRFRRLLAIERIEILKGNREPVCQGEALRRYFCIQP